MSHTRIIILQLKEIIYTAIFAGLGILLLILLFFMFWPDHSNDSASTSPATATAAVSSEDTSDISSTGQDAVDTSATDQDTSDDAKKTDQQTSATQYKAGVYTTEMNFGDSVINLQVTLDSDHVKSVEAVHLDDAVSTMYPLILPSIKNISDQLAQNISPEEVVLSDDAQYTEKMILESVSSILKDASAQQTTQ